MLNPVTKIFLNTCTIDFRKSYHGLCALVKELFEEDSLSGAMLIFYNRLGNRLKFCIGTLMAYVCGKALRMKAVLSFLTFLKDVVKFA